MFSSSFFSFLLCFFSFETLTLPRHAPRSTGFFNPFFYLRIGLHHFDSVPTIIKKNKRIIGMSCDVLKSLFLKYIYKSNKIQNKNSCKILVMWLTIFLAHETHLSARFIWKFCWRSRAHVCLFLVFAISIFSLWFVYTPS